MPKFFIKTENLKENEEIWITGSDVNHIKNVLRKKVDDKINICNSDTQKNYECVIKNIEENKIVCKILDEVKSLAAVSYTHLFRFCCCNIRAFNCICK